jgi:hypothetical protein
MLRLRLGPRLEFTGLRFNGVFALKGDGTSVSLAGIGAGSDNIVSLMPPPPLLLGVRTAVRIAGPRLFLRLSGAALELVVLTLSEFGMSAAATQSSSCTARFLLAGVAGLLALPCPRLLADAEVDVDALDAACLRGVHVAGFTYKAYSSADACPWGDKDVERSLSTSSCALE